MFRIEGDTPKAPSWWPERERGTEGSAGGTGRCPEWPERQEGLEAITGSDAVLGETGSRVTGKF